MARVGNFAELCGRLSKSHKVFSIAYNGKEQRPRAEDFDLFCRAAYACTSIAVAVDEIDLHINSQWMPESLDNLVSLGRHRDISLYCATRRPKEIHPLIRSQAHQVISYQQTEPADLEWCRAVMGDKAEGLPTLGLHEAIVWNDTEYLTKSVPSAKPAGKESPIAPQEEKS